MKKDLHILGSCHIENDKIWVNGKTRYESSVQDESPIAFLKSAYKELGIKYAKFHKMDALCKLGFIASEFLMEGLGRPDLPTTKTGIHLCNSSSSLDTDMRHQESINDLEKYYPSPAVFVYTLPNIVIGEICIKNKIQGENAFFIFDVFNASEQVSLIRMLFEETDTECCLCGWVDLLKDEYEAFLYWIDVEPRNGKQGLIFNELNLEHLYKTKKFV